MGTLIELSSRRLPPASARPLQQEADRDLLAVGIPLWVGSVARVAVAFASHEVFATEATLALACALGLPWLLWRSRASAAAR
jgi:hypothetical protein